MSNLVTIITPTGGRQACFNLYAEYINRQTYQGAVQLIIVDDCKPDTIVPPMAKNISVEYYRGPKDWAPQINTQRLNLDFAFSKIKGNYIFFCEDDDWFSPNFLAATLGFLQYAQIAGESNARYFSAYVPGHKRMNNFNHASLSQTGITKELLPQLNLAINSGELYIDLILWRKALEEQRPALLVSNSGLSVGMKGLPGRAGITGSHRSKDFMFDPNFDTLKSWIGVEDTLKYQKLIKNGSK